MPCVNITEDEMILLQKLSKFEKGTTVAAVDMMVNRAYYLGKHGSPDHPKSSQAPDLDYMVDYVAEACGEGGDIDLSEAGVQ